MNFVINSFININDNRTVCPQEEKVEKCSNSGNLVWKRLAIDFQWKMVKKKNLYRSHTSNLTLSFPWWRGLLLPCWPKIQFSDCRLCLSKDRMALMPRGMPASFVWRNFFCLRKFFLSKITFVLSATKGKRTGRAYYGTGTHKWRS